MLTSSSTARSFEEIKYEKSKMKTQTFGLSVMSMAVSYLCPPACPPCGDFLVLLLYYGTKKEEIDKCKCCWKCVPESLQNYRENRENGSGSDNPSWEFPNDGIYKWDTPNENCTKVRYAEGPKDAAWMAEKDRNYLKKMIWQIIYDITPLPIELIKITLDYLTVGLPSVATNSYGLWSQSTQAPSVSSADSVSSATAPTDVLGPT